jgi:hypothetical protein
MKLYTEEEIRKFFTEKYDEGLSIDELIEILTPIELPSDEEIKDASLEDNNDDLSPAEEFQQGAKWIRDKIQGGNNDKQ